MLTRICRKNGKDRIRNEDIRAKLRVLSIEDKIIVILYIDLRQIRLQFLLAASSFEMYVSAPVKKCKSIELGMKNKCKDRLITRGVSGTSCS